MLTGENIRRNKDWKWLYLLARTSKHTLHPLYIQLHRNYPNNNSLQSFFGKHKWFCNDIDSCVVMDDFSIASLQYELMVNKYVYLDYFLIYIRWYRVKKDSSWNDNLAPLLLCKQTISALAGVQGWTVMSVRGGVATLLMAIHESWPENFEAYCDWGINVVMHRKKKNSLYLTLRRSKQVSQ